MDAQAFVDIERLTEVVAKADDFVNTLCIEDTSKLFTHWVECIGFDLGWFVRLAVTKKLREDHAISVVCQLRDKVLVVRGAYYHRHDSESKVKTGIYDAEPRGCAPLGKPCSSKKMGLSSEAGLIER